MHDARRQTLIIAVVSLLIGALFLLYEQVWNGGASSSAQSPATATAGQPSEDGDEEDGAENGDGPVRKAPERTATIETEHFVAEVTNRNGGLLRFEVKGDRYQDEDGNQKQLVTTDKEPYLPLHPELGGVDVPADASWELQALSEREVRLSWSGGGFTVVRKLEAGEGPYQLWLTTRVRNDSKGQRPIRLTETAFHYIPRDQEEGGGFFARPSPNRALGVCLWGDGEIERKGHDDLEQGQEGGWNPHPHRYPPSDQPNAGTRFAGVENVYFATVLAAHGEPAEACQMWSSGRGGTPEEPHGSLFESRLVYPRVELGPGEEYRQRTLAYVGPKDPDALAAAGHQLPKVIDLGWFAFIGEYLTELLRFIHGLVGNWGIAIILLTVLVKIVLYPLTEKSFRSMARMRQLKPEMDRINELYKDDREKKGAAVMELYRKHKINPLGGCLPTLLQLPIWFALYQSLSTNVELYHAEFFLWWQDLSSPDPFYVLPLMVGGLMFMQQRLTPTTMDPTQAKIMMYFMPVMITTFMLFLPAGLCLYIVTNSALSIAQQQFIQRRLDRAGAEQAEAGAAASGSGGNGSGAPGTDGSEKPAPGGPQPASASAAAANGSRPPSARQRKTSSSSSRRKSRGGKRRQRRGRA